MLYDELLLLFEELLLLLLRVKMFPLVDEELFEFLLKMFVPLRPYIELSKGPEFSLNLFV